MGRENNTHKTKYLFVPGCAIRKKLPGITKKLHKHLKNIVGEVKLYDNCCGSKIKISDSVVLITVCQACNKAYGKHNNLELRSIWDIIDQNPGVPLENRAEIEEAITKTLAKKHK